MDYSAEIRYFSTKEVVMTGTSDGKSEPKYSFPDNADFDVEQMLLDTAAEAYRFGLYGTGSPGQVRDMLHAMQAVVNDHSNYEMRVPRDTEAKAEKEAKKDLKDLPDGAVF
jgi:hypothetical protein